MLFPAMAAPFSVPLREPQSAARLSRTFARSFTAVDLAEPLSSIDDNQPTVIAAAILQQQQQEVLGVRRSGSIIGWVQADDLNGQNVGEQTRPFQNEHVLDDSAGLDEVLRAFAHAERLFIRWLGVPAGVITRKDLQKAPLRMWMFGVITLFDLNMTDAIERMYPADTWQHLVSPGRLEKARALSTERQRCGAACGLVDCLQIKDKADILMQDSAHLTALGFSSRREADRFTSKIESLRNHLAHVQELDTGHLQTCTQLAALASSIVQAEGVQRLFEARAATASPPSH
jgi:hypothetical protein